MPDSVGSPSLLGVSSGDLDMKRITRLGLLVLAVVAIGIATRGTAGSDSPNSAEIVLEDLRFTNRERRARSRFSSRNRAPTRSSAAFPVTPLPA